MDVSEIPHFNLSYDVCQDCLAEEEKLVKASAGAVEMARDEKVGGTTFGCTEMSVLKRTHDAVEAAQGHDTADFLNNSQT
jgi:hypothetical protein